MGVHYTVTLCDQSQLRKQGPESSTSLFEANCRVFKDPQVITTDSQSELVLDNEQNGVIIIDEDEHGLNVNCISNKWQDSNVQIDEWCFEDISGEIDTIKNIVITGTSNTIEIDKSESIESIMDTFKNRTDTLLKILTST